MTGPDPNLVEIPRIIHQVWVGPRPIPAHFAAYRSTWAALHPAWDLHLWTDAALADLDPVLRSIVDNAADYVPADAVGQLRADVVRLDRLYQFGGLYVDMDTEALTAIDQHLAGSTAWAAAEDDRWIGNTYVAATPGHPVIGALLDGLPASVARHRGRRPNQMTGPKYLTPIWRAHGATVAPWRQFFPYSYRHVTSGTVPDTYPPDTVAVHHWQHTRETTRRR